MTEYRAMEGFRQAAFSEGNAKIIEAQDRVNEAEQKLHQSVKELEFARFRLSEIRERAASIDAFLCGLQPADRMPERGEPFINPAYHPPHCIVENPRFGFAVRFTVSHDGRPRTVDGVEGFEFVSGDLLEFLGVGGASYWSVSHVGDPIEITDKHMRDGTMLRHAVEPHEEEHREQAKGQLAVDPRIIDTGNYRGPGRITHIGVNDFTRVQDWPAVSGTIVSVEPRCRAYTHLPESVQSLEEAKDLRRGLLAFTLRQIFLPLGPSMKAAAKKK